MQGTSNTEKMGKGGRKFDHREDLAERQASARERRQARRQDRRQAARRRAEAEAQAAQAAQGVPTSPAVLAAMAAERGAY